MCARSRFHRRRLARSLGVRDRPEDPESVGAPDTIRTCDPCLRRAVLYPTELRARRCRILHDFVAPPPTRSVPLPRGVRAIIAPCRTPVAARRIPRKPCPKPTSRRRRREPRNASGEARHLDRHRHDRPHRRHHPARAVRRRRLWRPLAREHDPRWPPRRSPGASGPVAKLQLEGAAAVAARPRRRPKVAAVAAAPAKGGKPTARRSTTPSAWPATRPARPTRRSSATRPPGRPRLKTGNDALFASVHQGQGRDAAQGRQRRALRRRGQGRRRLHGRRLEVSRRRPTRRERAISVALFRFPPPRHGPLRDRRPAGMPRAARAAPGRDRVRSRPRPPLVRGRPRQPRPGFARAACAS